MVLFAIEQSKTAYWADFAFYLALVVGLSAVLLVPDAASSRLATAAVVLLGVLSWTVIEYALHRLVLHRLCPFRAWHERHHLRPRALICTPTIVSAALFALLVYLPALVLTNGWLAAAYTLGVLIGYLSYAVTHHAIHHWHIDHTWLRRRKHWHALHHGVAIKICYGVTSEFLDGLFGSRPVGPGTTGFKGGPND
jgi:cyclopropane-fatty-acyl-phospholipid synthase